MSGSFLAKFNTCLFTKSEFICIFTESINTHSSANLIEEEVTGIFKRQCYILLSVCQLIFIPYPAGRLIVGIIFIYTLVLNNLVCFKITRFKRGNSRKRLER